MSDTLIGVVVGGLIAWIAPLITLRYAERRWKFEARLAHLKAERERFERLYERNLELFARGMAENSYSSNLTTDILVLMPKEIAEFYVDWMKQADKSEAAGRDAYADMAKLMKEDIARRDEEISRLLKQ